LPTISGVGASASNVIEISLFEISGHRDLSHQADDCRRSAEVRLGSFASFLRYVQHAAVRPISDLQLRVQQDQAMPARRYPV
jgi:hypothetical protein